jgi:hypothetical protein
MAMRPSAGLSGAVRTAFVTAALTLAGPTATWRPVTLEAGAVSDTKVKAAFLFNFTKFVTWPAGSGQLVIGIAGDDAFADVVTETIRGRSVNGRELQTRRLTDGADPAGCQVVFVATARPHDALEWLQRLRGPVLTVGETVQFLRDGGMVRLYVENNTVRFQINQKNAEAAGLKISSQLLALAAR